MYPKIIINMTKLEHNINFLSNKLKKNQLTVNAITKLHGANERIIELFEKNSNIQYFGDSRIQNLKNLQKSKKKKVLIRIPMHSEVDEVTKYADVSFNSELSTIKLLNESAKRQQKIHQILIMVDLGDLREGFYEEVQLIEATKETLELSNIEIVGLGVNLMCYGGVVPDVKNLGKLVDLARKLREQFSLELPIISGGNSSSLYLLEESICDLMPAGITDLRIGDAFFTGSTSFGIKIAGMHNDVFLLQAQIVELKHKPSYPIGQISVDAFGKVPTFEDKGIRLKGILAVGRQDIAFDGLTPIDDGLEVLGASSDHLVIDFTGSKKTYNVGDIVEFEMHYGSVLQSFTSKYVAKEYEY